MTGLPVVTTDVPGAREVVVDGATGFVVSVDDFDGLVERTQALLLDAELRIALGVAAAAHCVTNFSLVKSLERWQWALGTHQSQVA